MKLSAHGTKEMIVGTILLLALAAVLGWLWWPLAFVPVPVIVWLFAFFRDPERPIPTGSVVVSPADGLVTDVTDVENDPLIGGPAVRIGIFLSVFNVHINRAPLEGKVLDITYKKGTFKSALRHGEASTDNECNTILLGDIAMGRPIAVVRQIAGLIARRIVCTTKPGDVLKTGERLGLIKFGSRTELTIAKHLNPVVDVKVGQKLRGAADVVARLGTPANAYA
ncbi:MAG: phosphatidylserine decarboxylase [Tepidisphaeraceae bacterium]